MVSVIPYINCYIICRVDSNNCILNECVCLMVSGLDTAVMVILVLFSYVDGMDVGLCRDNVILWAVVLDVSIIQSDDDNTVLFTIQVLDADADDICIYYGNTIIIIIPVGNTLVLLIINV